MLNRKLKRVAAAALLAPLLAAGPAAAHVSVRPALLESGSEVLLRIEVPGLRPGQDPTALRVSGPGVRELSSERTGRLGAESRWRVRIRVESEPGPLPLVLLARYEDGRSVRVRQTVTVLPVRASNGSGTPVLALAAGLAATLAAASLAALAFLNFKKKSRSAC